MQGLMARDGRPKKQQLLYRTTRPEMHMALPVDGHQCTVPKYHRSRHAENARSSKAEKRQSFFFHSAYNRLGRHGCHVIHLSRSRKRSPNGRRHLQSDLAHPVDQLVVGLFVGRTTATPLSAWAHRKRLVPLTLAPSSLPPSPRAPRRASRARHGRSRRAHILAQGLHECHTQRRRADGS